MSTTTPQRRCDHCHELLFDDRALECPWCGRAIARVIIVSRVHEQDFTEYELEGDTLEFIRLPIDLPDEVP